MMSVAQHLINKAQLGFLPNRYIADHGMTLQIIMEDARLRRSLAPSTEIALLLDQEKAYDRVNLHYLSQVLTKFGFPQNIVTCLYNLMYYNQINININGFLTDPVHKRRGLKQGDPISPLLYNLALEPFLLSIIGDSQMSGYRLQLHDQIATHSIIIKVQLKIPSKSILLFCLHTFTKSYATLMILLCLFSPLRISIDFKYTSRPTVMLLTPRSILIRCKPFLYQVKTHGIIGEQLSRT